MRTHPLLVTSILLLLAPPAWAQRELPAHKWSHCTTLSMSGGAAGAPDQSGATIGAAIGWEITPRVGWEVSGTWFDRQPGSTAFSAALSFRTILAQSLEAAPFVEGGFGLYSASFDPKVATDIPAFYSDRMSGVATNRFNDPAFFAAVGADIYRSNRLAVRPTIGATMAVQDGRTHTVAAVMVHVEYHFGGLPPALSRR
jgi:hypothetical protein